MNPTALSPAAAGPREGRERAGSAGRLRIAGPLILVGSALVVLTWALAYGGAAEPLAIGDPGPLVRWGLPVAKLLVNLSAAGLVGVLVLVAPHHGDSSERSPSERSTVPPGCCPPIRRGEPDDVSTRSAPRV